MGAPDPAPRRARHLIDPDAPRAPRDPATVRSEQQRLRTVQQWVLSTLAATTILHLAGGLVVAALFLDGTRAEQVALCAIAAVFGVLAVAAARAIHEAAVLSPWLVLGVLPGVVGVALVLA